MGLVPNDAEWHTVGVSRWGLEVTLVVDESSFSHTLSGTELTLDIDPSGIFAGGRPEAGGTAGNYTGCLQVKSTLPELESLLFLRTRELAISYHCCNLWSKSVKLCIQNCMKRCLVWLHITRFSLSIKS